MGSQAALIKEFLSRLAQDDPDGAIALLDAGLSVRTKYGRTCQTPLLLASGADESDVGRVIDALLARGANIEESEAGGNRPLHQAAFAGAAAAARALLERGATVDALNARGRTPLTLAVVTELPGGSAVREVLMANGANPDLPDNQGQSARYLADAWGIHLPDRA